VSTPTITRLPRPRDVTGHFGLYVHVPFCSHRCWYCDFNAYDSLDHLADAYMDALATDIREARSAPAGADLAERPTITSVFIGGGTPSLVAASGIAGVMNAIRDAWDIDPSAEVTIEANPESLDASKLDVYLAAGINRVSIGVQSLDPVSLERLGRIHSAKRALQALELAQERGFERVSGDLIFGIPGEDDDMWRASLDGVVGSGVTHVSCYGLTYEEGTPLEAWRRLGHVVPEPDDDVARRWEIADATLASAGFERYEISNWARPGRECRHNLLYWACGEYLGIGAGAHSHLACEGASVRSWTVKAPARYTSDVTARQRPVGGSERIDAPGRAAEVMFLGLRRCTGVSRQGFADLTGTDLDTRYGPVLERSLKAGLLEPTRDGYRLTARGTLVANEVVTGFLDPA
jgi:oxygen-independent coproporphyrinogen-3 oxidase